ncbi:MAG: FMN-binding protein [Planctomycetota bacterium]|jgi:Na+-translocating ferredoxin:NAD+ oxidoreductase RnfG subunit
MSKMLLQLMLLASAAPGLAVLAAVSGCADSAVSDAMQIEAVQEVFPSAMDISRMSIDRGVQTPGRPGYPIVGEIRDSSGLLGYSVVSEVRGRSGPFKIQVLLDKQYVVRRATVISYPWSHGREVGRRSFSSQFEGKGPEDAIEIGEDIDAATGATISSGAMARGVREAVRLLAE